MKKLIPVLLILFTLIVLAGCEKEPVIEKFTVTFDHDNGKEKTEVTVEKGKTVEKIADPVKDGCVFMEWRTPDGEEYDFTKAVVSNITLKAAYWLDMSEDIQKKAFTYWTIARLLAGETEVAEIAESELQEVFVSLNPNCRADLSNAAFYYEHDGTKYYYYDGKITHDNYVYVDIAKTALNADKFETTTGEDGITTTVIKNLVIKATCYEGTLDGTEMKKKDGASAFVAGGENVTITGEAFYSVAGSTALYGFINNEGKYSDISDEKAGKITYFFEDSTGSYIKTVDIPKTTE